jgi:ABC-type sugar transport system permease subunit
MLYGAWISLNRWDGIGDPKFVGLRNYQRLLADPNLLISLRNNVVLCAALLLGMVVPLFVAVLLHNRIWGWQFFRLVFFIPAAISPLVIGLYWSAFLRADGPLDAVLQALGLDSLSHHLWLADPTTALPWIAVILIWSTFGTAIILFMAGLAGINPDLYDAATVDGASWLQTFRHITVPGLMPIIIFWGIQLLIFSFTSLFAFIYTLTGGGPGHSTSVIEFELYNAAFLGRFMGYGSAIGMFILTIVFALVAAVMVLSGRRVEETSY